jgi:hypothetical protein
MHRALRPQKPVRKANADTSTVADLFPGAPEKGE